jgi:hypothetical protein
MTRTHIRDFVLRSARARMGRLLSRKTRDAMARMSRGDRLALTEARALARERVVRWCPDEWFARDLTASEKSQVSRELRRMESAGLVVRFNVNWRPHVVRTGWLGVCPLPTLNTETPARD